MALVTVELRNLLKTDFELFDFDYEFDDKNMAKQLEEAIIDFYYGYEIGGTPDAFKRSFRLRWRQAMSYYNQIHNTSLLEYNPLINYKISESLEQLSKSDVEQDTTTDHTNESISNTTGNENINSSSNEDSTQNITTENSRTDSNTTQTDSDELTSDYPQQPIGSTEYANGRRVLDSTTNTDGNSQDNGASNSVGSTESTGESTSNSTSNTTGNITDSTVGNSKTNSVNNTEYEKKVEGLTGRTYQELIRLERENIVRITGLVIEEMKPCFILIYS